MKKTAPPKPLFDARFGDFGSGFGAKDAVNLPGGFYVVAIEGEKGAERTRAAVP